MAEDNPQIDDRLPRAWASNADESPLNFLINPTYAHDKSDGIAAKLISSHCYGSVGSHRGKVVRYPLFRGICTLQER
jgi:hypothetical protein